MRIQAKPLNQYPWYLRLLFNGQKRKYGQVLISGLLWGRVPRLFVAISLVFGFLNRKKSPISPTLRALLCVRISQINVCNSCIDLNSALIAEREGSMVKVDALDNWRDSDVFTDQERISLEYAESITFSDRQISDDLFARLRSHFDEEAIVELTGLIGYQYMSNIFNVSLQIPTQGLCQMNLKN